jgi:hypothetical protein
MKKLLALILLLPLVLFTISTNLSASPVGAITKWIGMKWNENKKVYSIEFSRCLESHQDYLVELDIQSGDFEGSDEVYLDNIFPRARKYCEAVIPENRRYKQTDK